MIRNSLTETGSFQGPIFFAFQVVPTPITILLRKPFCQISGIPWICIAPGDFIITVSSEPPLNIMKRAVQFTSVGVRMSKNTGVDKSYGPRVLSDRGDWAGLFVLLPYGYIQTLKRVSL